LALEKEPDAQSWQLDPPDLAWNLPSAQFEQLDWPFTDWYVPAAQLMQAAALSPE